MGQPEQQTQQDTRLVFCANCQKDTPHTAAVDVNGEFVFTCTTEGCGRFIKLPPDTTPESADAYFASHKDTNAGQVSLEPQQKKLQSLLVPTQKETPAE